jgi:hypothetical protein
MRRTAAIVLALVLFGASAGFAEGGLFLTPSAGAQFDIFQLMASAAVRADYYFNSWFGVGLDVEGAYGVTYGDAFVNLMITIVIGWFYLGGGESFKVADASLPATTAADSILPCFTIGLVIPVIQIGPGRIVIDAGLDTYVSAMIVYPGNDTNPFAYLANAFSEALYGVPFSFPKPDVKIGYSIGF